MEPHFGTKLRLLCKTTLLHCATRLALGGGYLHLFMVLFYFVLWDGYGQRVDRERWLFSDPPSSRILAVPPICCLGAYDLIPLCYSVMEL